MATEKNTTNPSYRIIEKRRVSAYLPDRTNDRLEEMVATSNRTRSAIITDAIDMYYRVSDSWK